MVGEETSECLVFEGLEVGGVLVERSVLGNRRDALEVLLNGENFFEMLGEVTLDLNDRVDSSFLATEVDEVTGLLRHGELEGLG